MIPEVQCLNCGWEGYAQDLSVEFSPDEDACPSCGSTEEVVDYEAAPTDGEEEAHD